MHNIEIRMTFVFYILFLDFSKKKFESVIIRKGDFASDIVKRESFFIFILKVIKNKSFWFKIRKEIIS